MTTWKFPDVLGGEEHDEHERVSGGTEAPIGTVAFHINGCLVCVAIALLTEVKPTLTPEPPNDSAVRVGRQIYRRDDLAAYNTEGSTANWYGAGFTAPNTWADLCTQSAPDGPVLLVPAPPVVELPWTAECANGNGTIQIQALDDDEQIPVVLPGAGTVYLARSDARTGAYALLAAAELPSAPKPCSAAWTTGAGCYRGNKIHDCALRGGHTIHRCTCGASTEDVTP